MSIRSCPLQYAGMRNIECCLSVSHFINVCHLALLMFCYSFSQQPMKQSCEMHEYYSYFTNETLRERMAIQLVKQIRRIPYTLMAQHIRGKKTMECTFTMQQNPSGCLKDKLLDSRENVNIDQNMILATSDSF